MLIIKGATLILFLNLFGIIAVSVVIFLLMNLSEKENIANSTMKREEEKQESENKAIAEVEEKIADLSHEKKKVIKENIVV